jgi:methyl-accepting chemotaxis protein
MKITPLYKYFNNISLSKKLYFTVGIMAILIMTELFTLSFSINTISSVRACVEAESLWSKVQKDALWQLIKYSQGRNETDYTRFRQLMKVMQGTHTSLVELSKQKPGVELAKWGLIEAGSNPDDVAGMINLFRRFHSNLFIRKAMAAWSSADSLATELIPIGERLHTDILLSNGSVDVNKVLQQLGPLNENLTQYEGQFSFALSQGSRWMEQTVLRVLFVFVITVEITGLLLAVILSRGIQRGLTDILLSARAIAKGTFDRKARVYSKDEIGILATAFNKMAEDLRHSAEENELALRECLKILGIHGDKIKEELGRPHPGTREQ